MHLDRATDNVLAGATLLAFVASLIALNAVLATLHVSWMVVALGGLAVTTLASRTAARAIPVPLAQRVDGEVVRLDGDGAAHRR